MKIAIITGASSGMGKEFAYRLSKENDVDELWLVARRKDRLCEIAENIDKPCRILSFDLSNPDMIEELEKIIGRKKPDIKWLVNSAGYGLIGNFEEFDGIRQSGVVSVNCTALTAVTGICLPHMHEGAKIVNMASASAFLPQPGFSVYAASKSYVLSFSRALRQELKKRKICVVAICPGPVDTEFFKTAQDKRPVKAYKKLFMVKSDFVVRGAMRAAHRNRAAYTPTIRMKLFRIAVKILPHGFIIKFL